MKIGLLIYGSLDTVTGGYIYDKRMVAHLVSQGDQVEIISLPWRNYPHHLLDNFSATLRARLLNLEVDLLIQDELCHPSLFMINSQLRGKVKYPIIALVHHLRSSEKHPWWARWLYRRIEKAYLNTVDGYICNSQTTLSTVDSFTTHLPPNVVAYPGGDRLGDPISEAEIRRRALRGGPLRVVFLGSITRRKQAHVVVRASSSLPIELTLIGSQDAEPKYARRVLKMISGLPEAASARILDPLNADELRGVLAKQDILVLPSTYEGFGIVYLEGMAFGLPAVGTTHGAASETIRHGENGLLIQPGDSAALANHLKELAENRQRLLEMSLAALRTYQSGPTWDQMGRSVHAFLHELRMQFES